METEPFPLHTAARNNDKNVVAKLLDQGYSINDRDNWNITPLMCAAGFGYCELVEFLINRGADMSAKIVEGVRMTCCGLDDDDGPSKYRGKTALILAVQYGFGQAKNAIDILIKSGAGVRLSDDVGWSEIQDITRGRDAFLHIVQYFVDEKFDLEDKTPEGDTILGIAARLEQIEAIDLLVKSGACFHADEYKAITVYFPQLKDRFLTDVEFCTKVVINNFNKKCLPALYSLPEVAVKLPCLKNMEIQNTTSVAREIAKRVQKEIQEKTYCNVMEVQPTVLTVLSVKAFLKANIPSPLSSL